MSLRLLQHLRASLDREFEVIRGQNRPRRVPPRLDTGQQPRFLLRLVRRRRVELPFQRQSIGLVLNHESARVVDYSVPYDNAGNGPK